MTALRDPSFDLLEDLGRFAYDPLGYVYWAYPWGEPGELERYPEGPDGWHIEVLEYLGQELRRDPLEPILISVASGHGVGKSACVGWLTDWAMNTHEDTRGVITANTENQLKTKTWVEISKWNRLSIARHLLKLTATALFSADPEREKGWRIDIVPWSERNTEAFAGLHNLRKRIVVILDEASAIPDPIWEVIEGALTDEDTQIIVLACGNPTRSTGRFRETMPDGKFGHRWKHFRVDSRSVRITNKAEIERRIADYGVDSDYVRVRILGLPPRVDASSFIAREAVLEAQARALPTDNPAHFIMGVDTARFGDDASCIVVRKGVDARSVRPIILRGATSIQIASRVLAEYQTYLPGAVFVDAGGPNAGGVIDLLTLWGVPVLAVDFSWKPDNMNPADPSTLYVNKRAEIWGAMRHWMRSGILPPDPPELDHTLVDELCEVTYSMMRSETSIQLESKADLKARGARSPDYGDALALTFAYPVLTSGYASLMSQSQAPDYDPFAPERLLA